MFNFGCLTKEDIKEHNPNWPQLPNHPCRILIVGGSGSGKRNAWFDLIILRNFYLFVKDPYEAKYQLLINTRKSASIKHFNDSKAFIKYSNDIDDIYKNIEEYNANEKRKYWLYLKIWYLIPLVRKNLTLTLILNYLLEEENQIFLLFLSHSLVLLFWKILD